MQLVVMAAGIGSRYGGLKQIDPVGPSGEIVLDYAVYDALRAGFSRVVFIIRKDIEEVFRQEVGRHIEEQVETAYVFQELDKLPSGFDVPAGRAKPWGTGHAVLCAAEQVDTSFAVINADDFYGRGSFQVLGDYLRTARDADGVYDFCMVAFILDNTLTDHGHVSRGVCTADEQGQLASIVERTRIERFDQAVRYTEDDEHWHDLPADSIVSMNTWGFTPAFFDELRARFPAFLEKNLQTPKAEYLMPAVVDDLIREGKARVKVLRTDERWFGVTYPEDKPHVKTAIARMVDEGVYPESLWG